LKTLANGLSKLKNLEDLKFYAYSNDIEDPDAIAVLLTAIFNMGNLKSLDLKLEDNLIKDSGAAIIEKFLTSEHLALESITMDLKNNCISEDIATRLQDLINKR
jgi:hypothetical protein